MCRKREGRVKKTSVTILYIDFSLFFKVVFRDSEFLKEKRRSKKGEQKRKKEKRGERRGGGRDASLQSIRPHTFFASRLFLQTPSKALRNGPARGIKDERSYFAAHRPSRDSNRELVLGVVLFGCVVSSRDF